MIITQNDLKIAKTKYPKVKGQSHDRSGANKNKVKQKNVGSFSGEINNI